jgi:hypothetical protein
MTKLTDVEYRENITFSARTWRVLQDGVPTRVLYNSFEEADRIAFTGSIINDEVEYTVVQVQRSYFRPYKSNKINTHKFTRDYL